MRKTCTGCCAWRCGMSSLEVRSVRHAARWSSTTMHCRRCCARTIPTACSASHASPPALTPAYHRWPGYSRPKDHPLMTCARSVCIGSAQWPHLPPWYSIGASKKLAASRFACCSCQCSRHYCVRTLSFLRANMATTHWMSRNMLQSQPVQCSVMFSRLARMRVRSLFPFASRARCC